MSTPLRIHTSIAGADASQLADPGWEDRRDEAAAVMSVTVALAVVCGGVINWLGWAVGGLLALGLYLSCLGLAWRAGVGGSS